MMKIITLLMGFLLGVNFAHADSIEMNYKSVSGVEVGQYWDGRFLLIEGYDSEGRKLGFQFKEYSKIESINNSVDYCYKQAMIAQVSDDLSLTVSFSSSAAEVTFASLSAAYDESMSVTATSSLSTGSYIQFKCMLEKSDS